MDRLDDQNRPIAILNVGGVDLGPHQEATGIGHNMAFAPLDLLGRIVTPRLATFGRLDRITRYDITCSFLDYRLCVRNGADSFDLLRAPGANDAGELARVVVKV